ncbi:MAG: tetratricopeptide repeat protein [Alphaproteobacteria bacterium]
MLTAFAAAATSPAWAQTPDIRSLFQEILANPTDVEANLRYARAVEARGESRKALMAYERVLSVDPTNAIARRGLARLSGEKPAARTEWVVGLGAQYESNPRLLDTALSREGDASMLATLRVDDERILFGERWRSRLNLQGRLYASFDEGTLGYVGVDSGPVLSLGTLGTVRPMAGAEHARLIGGPLFSSIYGGAELALVGLGALYSVDAIVSFADFSERFPGRDGFLLRLRPQLAWAGLALGGDRLTVEPEVSWNAAVGEDHRYRYWGIGVSAFYSLPIADAVPLLGRLTGGPEAAVEYRSYAGRAPEESDDRRDWRFVPGLRLVGSHFLGEDVSVMLRYTLDRNRSTEAAKEYTNHAVSLMFYRRF